MHLFSFLANLIATIFMLLNLNAVMSIIFNVPAAVASTIVASRAVRRLTKFTNKGPEVFSYVLTLISFLNLVLNPIWRRNGQGTSTLAFRGTGAFRTKDSKKTEGVHIQVSVHYLFVVQHTK